MLTLLRLMVAVCLVGLFSERAWAQFPYLHELPPGASVAIAQKGRVEDGRLTVEISITSRVRTPLFLPYEALPWAGGSCGPFYFVVLIDGRGQRLPKFCDMGYPAQPLELKPGATIAETITFHVAGLKAADVRSSFVELLWVERRNSGVGQSGVIEFK